MKVRLFFLTFVVCVCVMGAEKKDDKSDIYMAARQAVVNKPAESVDWWACVVDYYRSKDDFGHVVLIGPKNTCTKGPKIRTKTVKDNEVELTTEPMNHDTETYGYIITDKDDNYVTHIPLKKKLTEGEALKIKFKFAKASVPEIISSKYRCVGDDCKVPVKEFYTK